MARNGPGQKRELLTVAQLHVAIAIQLGAVHEGLKLVVPQFRVVAIAKIVRREQRWNPQVLDFILLHQKREAAHRLDIPREPRDIIVRKLGLQVRVRRGHNLRDFVDIPDARERQNRRSRDGIAVAELRLQVRSQ